MNRKGALNKTFKESSGKEKTLYLKVNYNLGCIPALSGIYQDRVEIDKYKKQATRSSYDISAHNSHCWTAVEW